VNWLEDPRLVGAFGQLLTGTSRGMVYFVVASGLSIILGVLRVPNFAHGSFYMTAAFLAFTVYRFFTTVSAGFWMALLLAPLGVAGMSLLIERCLLKYTYRKESMSLQFLLLFGMIFIINDLIRLIWGPGFKSVGLPEIFTGAFTIWRVSISRYHVGVIALGSLIAISMWFLMRRTRIGKIARAAAVDREMVSALGINVSWVFSAVFATGGWLAGLGGALIAPTTGIQLGMDLSMLITVFLILCIAGLGNLWGVLWCSLILGVGESFGIWLLPHLGLGIPFALAAIIMIARPAGLFKSIW
jgi:branched-chain amino acid transport system permease protein